jgi:hypothetical protein
MQPDLSMNEDDFIAQFEACTLPQDNFHHADHLHAAWLYLTRFPAAEAIARFAQTLKSYAAALGKADRYHETVTWAYMLVVNERIGAIRAGAQLGTVHERELGFVRLEELSPAAVLPPGDARL